MASENSVITEEVNEEYSEQFYSEISRQNLLEEFRLRNLYCDFVIKAGNYRWNCHQNVLVAMSPYFQTMLTSTFLESSSGEVEFPDYMSDCVDIVLKYIYTGSIKISVSNVVAVHRVGSYLLINDLVDMCIDFINRNFELVSKSDGFLSLEWIVLANIIAYNQQQANEQCIWEAIMKWVKHDPENRSEVLPKLMEHVRFDLISPTYLCQNIAQDDLVTSSTECTELIYKLLTKRLIQSESKGATTSVSRYSVIEDVYVIGGERDGSRVVNYVLKYNSQDGKWSGMKCLDIALASFGTTVVNNNIYTAGGRSSNNRYSPISNVLMFDSDAKKWLALSELNVSRRTLGVCSVSNTIYACGGIDSRDRALNSVEFCDLGVGSWKDTAPMNEYRGFVKVVSLEGSIWALGGKSYVGGWTNNRTVERFDPREGWWAHQSNMTTARGDHGAVVFDNKIYVCGGDSFEEYDPRNKKWRLLSPMLQERSYPALVVNGGKIWAIGGKTESVEIYNRSRNKWTLGTPLPFELREHCAVILPHSS